LKLIKVPISEGYDPEIDDTPIYTEEYSAKCRSIISCCIWIVVLGRFNIAYATSAMSRFNLLPSEGHLKAAKRILAYLKTLLNVRFIVDPTYTNHSIYPTEDYPNFKEFYPDSEKEIRNQLPKTKRTKIRMTIYVDADYAHDLETSKFIKVILSMLNSTPTR
jgi:hypothetical protein